MAGNGVLEQATFLTLESPTMRECPAVQAREALTGLAAADYYGAGNAERVAAARDRTRRKLTSSHSRDPSDTNLETPGLPRLPPCLAALSGGCTSTARSSSLQ